MLLIVPVVTLLIGVWMVIWPERRVEAVKARMRAGDDRFHEEQRSYAAYAWLRSVTATRRWGWVLIVASLGSIALRSLR